MNIDYKKYLPIKALNESAYDLVLRALEEDLADGKYDLENGAYAFVSTYVTKPIKDGLYEAHRAFTDVQLILQGQEIIGITSISKMHEGECVKEYEYDIELYRVSGGNLNVLSSGDYLILTSQNAHMPGVSHNPSTTKKLVIKIPE